MHRDESSHDHQEAQGSGGSVSGQCGIRTEVGFFFYDLAGPTLSVTPYVAFDVSARPNGFDFMASPGVRGALGGRLNVFGREFFRPEFPLFDVKTKTPSQGSVGL